MSASEPCRAWGTLRGCRFGADCKYTHEGAQGDAARTRVSTKGGEACKGWSSDNGCRYGDKCPYTHTGKGKLYVEKSEAEKAKEECRGWKSTKGCKSGDKCAYKHIGATGKTDKPAAAAASGEKGDGRRRTRKPAGEKKPAEPTKSAEEKAKEECNNWVSDKGCWRGTECPYKHVGKTGNANPEKPERRRRGGDKPATA